MTVLKTEANMKEHFHACIREASSICVLGHIGPDGDCAGSTLGVYNYIRSMDKGKRVQVYLEPFSEKFSYLSGYEAVCHDTEDRAVYDLCIICDCADDKRLGKFAAYQKEAKYSFCIDHHATNTGFGDAFVIKPEASSTCEVLYDLLDEAYIDRDVACCIYTGLVHDTGVFRYSSTSPHTMEIAGNCMAFGIPFGDIIDDSFFSMSFVQKEVKARVLAEMQLLSEGRIVMGSIDIKTMELYGVTSKDMDGIIDELRTTRGVLMAVFMYQTQNRQYKVSMRSNSDRVNVAKIAQSFGGGGHVKAAGCFMGASVKENMGKILIEAEKQFGTGEI